MHGRTPDARLETKRPGSQKCTPAKLRSPSPQRRAVDGACLEVPYHATPLTWVGSTSLNSIDQGCPGSRTLGPPAMRY
jgi:hypothetical protein